MKQHGTPAFGRHRHVVVGSAAAVALCALLSAMVVGAVLDRPLTDFTREPQHVLGGQFYVGYVAVLGILGWWTAAVAALFTAATAAGERREFLILAAALAFLAIDDTFQLHELVLPTVVGIPELVVYGLYGVTFLTLVVRGRSFLARYDVELAVAAGALLTVSVGVDVLQSATHLHSRVAEQATKLTGIALVAVFTWGAATSRLRRDREPVARPYLSEAAAGGARGARRRAARVAAPPP